MQFLKVKDNKLYTPVVGYKRGDTEAVVTGMVHIGLPLYYSQIQREIDKVPVGFFERVGPILDEASVSPEKRPYIQSFQELSKYYRDFARYLHMQYQGDALNY